MYQVSKMGFTPTLDKEPIKMPNLSTQVRRRSKEQNPTREYPLLEWDTCRTERYLLTQIPFFMFNITQYKMCFNP